MVTSYQEETDRPLPEYPLPEQIERLIDAGKYSNVENRVTKVWCVVCVCVGGGGGGGVRLGSRVCVCVLDNEWRISFSPSRCQDNYKRRMHNLLYLEEYQQRVDMSR